MYKRQAQHWLAWVTEPDPITLTVSPPADGVLRVRPGAEIALPARLARRPGVHGNVRLSLGDPPEWLTLKTKAVGGRADVPQTVRLAVSANAEPGQTGMLLLQGAGRIETPPDDPEFNPVAKWGNYREVNFAVVALPVEVTE